MSSRTLYLDGEYLARNPAWHVEESAWKAANIIFLLRRNHLSPASICDVGCGAGEVLHQLQQHLSPECSFHGYDVSPQAIELAGSRANEKLHFSLMDFRNASEASFELILVLDVIEHLEDYFGFLGQLKAKGGHKIFHIPLDLSAQTVFRKNALLKRRQMYGHLHYFSKETALETLRDSGYEILDYFYTSRANDLGSTLGQMLLKFPRRLLFSLHEDFAVRLLGGFSMLVLAR